MYLSKVGMRGERLLIAGGRESRGWTSQRLMTQHLLSFQPREPDGISEKFKEADIKAESSTAAAGEWASKPHCPLVVNSARARAIELTEKLSVLYAGAFKRWNILYTLRGTAVPICWLSLDLKVQQTCSRWNKQPPKKHNFSKKKKKTSAREKKC